MITLVSKEPLVPSMAVTFLKFVSTKPSTLSEVECESLRIKQMWQNCSDGQGTWLGVILLVLSHQRYHGCVLYK